MRLTSAALLSIIAVQQAAACGDQCWQNPPPLPAGPDSCDECPDELKKTDGDLDWSQAPGQQCSYLGIQGTGCSCTDHDDGKRDFIPRGITWKRNGNEHGGGAPPGGSKPDSHPGANAQAKAQANAHVDSNKGGSPAKPNGSPPASPGGQAFAGKCARAKISPEQGPSFSHQQPMPIKNMKIACTHDTPVQMTYHYDQGPQKGKTCTHSANLKAGQDTDVPNEQCGGATRVECKLPKPIPNCEIGVRKMKFDCSQCKKPPQSKPPQSLPPASSKPPKPPSSAPPSSPPYTTPSSSSPPESKPPGTSPPESKPPMSSPPGESSSTPQPSSPPQSSPPPQSSSPPQSSNSPETTSPPESKPPVPSSPSTPIQNSTMTTSKSESKPESPQTPSSSPESNSPETTTSSSPAETKPNSPQTPPSKPAESTPPGSTVPVVTTEIVYTTITTCQETTTHTEGGKTSVQVIPTISTVVVTSTKTICTKCVAPPKTDSPPQPGASSPSPPPTSPNSPVQPPPEQPPKQPEQPPQPAPAPGLLPSCLQVWITLTKCKSITDSDCFCKEQQFTKTVQDCVNSWSQHNDELQGALSYLAGICAPHIPQNPGLVTNVPSTITLAPVPASNAPNSPVGQAPPAQAPAQPNQPPPAGSTPPPPPPPAPGAPPPAAAVPVAPAAAPPSTVIPVSTTVTLPCPSGAQGAPVSQLNDGQVEAGGNMPAGSCTTTSVLQTSVTVPQVAFTGTGSNVGLIAGTAPPAAQAAAPTEEAAPTGAAPVGSNAPIAPSTTAPVAPYTGNMGCKSGASGVVLSVVLAAMGLALFA